MYWLISNRDQGGTGTGINPAGLTYWVSDGGGLSDIGNWHQRTPEAFQSALIAAASKFPPLTDARNEQQSHVTLLIHGFNNSFLTAIGLYQKVCDSLFNGPASIGLCVLYDWPSAGNMVAYEPDRFTARKCAEGLADILSDLYDWLLVKQRQAMVTPSLACKAKVSVIAHSMGNYVFQKAMAAAWIRKNKPLLASLVNQLVMIAADVDNDLFDAGASDNGDGDAMANLVYRITALYSGRDAVLGASAGLKHFGTRRLGRSGLAHVPPLVSAPPETDNVWNIDCSALIPANVDGEHVHSAYFDSHDAMDLVRKVMSGVDRGVLAKELQS
jgi:esterase/lipase superfamily enzyme